MKTFIKFISFTFFKSLLFVFLVMISLVYILNLLSELDFFKEINVEIYFPLFLSLLNSPDMIFEMFHPHSRPSDHKYRWRNLFP